VESIVADWLASEFCLLSIDQQLDFLKTRMDFGSSSQNFAEHDLNMQLDRGFRAVFGCWLHVFSASEFWISVHEKSGLLAAEFRKSTDRSISSSIS
jgi:hypothetical protein